MDANPPPETSHHQDRGAVHHQSQVQYVYQDARQLNCDYQFVVCVCVCVWVHIKCVFLVSISVLITLYIQIVGQTPRGGLSTESEDDI